MNVESAILLVNNLVFIPKWKFIAEDHTNRFEGAILVRIEYPARMSERKYAPEYAMEFTASATFPLVVRDCDELSLYYYILCVVRKIMTHEIREFLRVSPTEWAPFHPHRVDGMQRWAELDGSSVEEDLKFGLG